MNAQYLFNQGLAGDWFQCDTSSGNSTPAAGGSGLDQICSPVALRRVPVEGLPRVAAAIRHQLIASVSQSGGHFASNLGAVELAVALHFVFDTPRDQLVWDTGHQAYPHKMLTGRRHALPGFRARGGLSGFPRREESPYDAFGVGHAGTAVSAALGMALSRMEDPDAPKVVAVVGDGASSAGMTFEAMNHAGAVGADLLVILNHNGMSISPGVGALQSHLDAAVGSRCQPHVEGGMPPRIADSVFEALGFAVYGPVDGHDVVALTRTLRQLRGHRGPRLLQVVTTKGKGHPGAEAAPVSYHALGPCTQPSDSEGDGSAPTFSDHFADWAMEKAREDRRLVCITPAMSEGSGLSQFAEAFPRRFHDVGIAEQHAVTLAGGLAASGSKPVVAIYSTFLQRGFDQIVHDVVLQDLPVLFAVDRAGLVGPDGATHAGSFDLSYLRCLPNLAIAAPSTAEACRAALDCAFGLSGPAAVRFPRGPARSVQRLSPEAPWVLGRGDTIRRGHRVAILNFGALLPEVLTAAERLDASVADMRWVKPIDEGLVRRLALEHDLLVTVEDNAIAGGAGSAVGELLSTCGLRRGLLQLGLPDRFLEQGSRGELLAECGLDTPGIVRATEKRLRRHAAASRLCWR